MEIKRLREKGYRITLLTEWRFWQLVGPHHARRLSARRNARSKR